MKKRILKMKLIERRRIEEGRVETESDRSMRLT